MQNFIELLKDHTLILAAARSLEDIVAQTAPAPGAAARGLSRLSRLLTAHLHAEAEFIRLDCENNHQEFAALRDSHGERFEDLVMAWTAHVQAWTEETIGRDWAGFRTETHGIHARLAEQLEVENRSLYPAALKYGLIRLLPDSMGDDMEARPAA